jgi:hypothetical protein
MGVACVMAISLADVSLSAEMSRFSHSEASSARNADALSCCDASSDPRHSDGYRGRACHLSVYSPVSVRPLTCERMSSLRGDAAQFPRE